MRASLGAGASEAMAFLEETSVAVASSSSRRRRRDGVSAAREQPKGSEVGGGFVKPIS